MGQKINVQQLTANGPGSTGSTKVSYGPPPVRLQVHGLLLPEGRRRRQEHFNSTPAIAVTPNISRPNRIRLNLPDDPFQSGCGDTIRYRHHLASAGDGKADRSTGALSVTKKRMHVKIGKRKIHNTHPCLSSLFCF